jgi:crotonobetainyl-CoA:carnitine CoA-transferase CaiB-like acyl-CoA transferase
VKLPLEGVRVVDLTAVWAGPYATRLLADLGAEVIKIESPTNPDLLRALGFTPPETERPWNKAAYFNHNNRNKLGCSLNLGTARGKELFLQLVAKSDAVIENYRAEVLDNLGLGYPVLQSAREDIILVSMPGHGKDGPERDYVAYGTNVEQLAGLVSLGGYLDDIPQKTGISYGDPVAGSAGAAALMMALLARRRTGKGQYVEIAQRENLTNMIGEYVVGYSIDQQLPRRIGNRHAYYAPHGCYPAAGDDKWITVACRSDAEFAALCGAIGQPDLAHDARFATAHERYQNQGDLDSIIADWTRKLDRSESFRLLTEAGVAAAPVLNHIDIYDDPHFRARGFFERVTHADAGEWDMERPLYRFDRRPTSIRRNAPMFGEHNDYVFRELLGLSAQDIEQLEQEGVTSKEPNMASHQ